MKIFLRLSGIIDRLNTWVGKGVMWLVLAAVLISAVNAFVRKAFDISSNAYLEAQWYLFATSFLLASAYTFLNHEHVKIDVISARFPKRVQVGIDIFGIVFFLIPVCTTLIIYSYPICVQAYVSQEMSSNAGGLIRWPIFMMVPIGFGLLLLQALSELIKRIAFLMGLIEDPTVKKVEKTSEQELAEAILAQAKTK